uniref:Uncharacterized protein n=1 Tax=Plectus sambesii TaxID=2011161 RepID=A0A914V298_9BILA
MCHGRCHHSGQVDVVATVLIDGEPDAFKQQQQRHRVKGRSLAPDARCSPPPPTCCRPPPTYARATCPGTNRSREQRGQGRGRDTDRHGCRRLKGDANGCVEGF